MTEIILHNYSQSPVAEKIRVVLGIKQLDWSSVEIPRIPPKPFLTILTGGYRRTPVMQIGADIYCDSLCIINELDRRFPTHCMYPTKNSGLAWCLGRWADDELFEKSVQIVLGSAGDGLAPEFAEDRGRLYFGPDWASQLKQAGESLPHLVAQIRSSFKWLDHHLSDEYPFIMGDAACAIDAQIYYVIWFLRGRWSQGPSFLNEFPNLVKWETRIRELGHGNQSDMSAQEAIQVATKSVPVSSSGITEHEPQAIQLGASVRVSPDVDGGEQPVTGEVVFADAQLITIARNEPDIGDLNVHFPRAGYKIEC